MKKFSVSLAILAIIIVPAFAFAQNTNTDDTNDNANVSLDAVANSNINTNSSVGEILDDAAKTEIEQEAEDLINDPGVLPDSPFYFLKVWGENITLFFTFNDDHKIETEYRYALRKIAEAQKMVEKGKDDIAEKHLENAEEKIARAQSRLEIKIENGADIDELVAKLELIQARQQDVLLDVYDQVPDEAKEAILRALENSAQGISNAIEKVKGQQGLDEFENEIEQKIENHGQETKLKVKTRVNGDESDIQIENRDDGTTEVQIEEENGDEPEDNDTNVNENENENENVNESEDETNDNSGSGGDSSDSNSGSGSSNTNESEVDN